MEQAVFKQFSRLDSVAFGHSIVPPDSFILKGTLTHHPINEYSDEYSSRKLLVSGSPTYNPSNAYII